MASGLVAAVLAIQVSVVVWIACCRPSVDRIDNLVHALSWGAESGGTALLLVHGAAEPSARLLDESTEGFATAALVLAVLGMALPIANLVGNCLLALYRRLA